jgi:hypothetical protein
MRGRRRHEQVFGVVDALDLHGIGALTVRAVERGEVGRVARVDQFYAARIRDRQRSGSSAARVQPGTHRPRKRLRLTAAWARSTRARTLHSALPGARKAREERERQLGFRPSQPATNGTNRAQFEAEHSTLRGSDRQPRAHQDASQPSRLLKCAPSKGSGDARQAERLSAGAPWRLFTHCWRNWAAESCASLACGLAGGTNAT